MRLKNHKQRIEEFIEEVGRSVRGQGSIYLVGGASAVWFGWRESTIDIDIDCAPEPPGFFAAIEGIKRKLEMSIELSSPSQFVPALANWQGRSEYICSAGGVDFFHYDFYSQAFAKLSRGHQQDALDVEKMVQARKVLPAKLKELVHQRAEQMRNFPNLDRQVLLAKVDEWADNHASTGKTDAE